VEQAQNPMGLSTANVRFEASLQGIQGTELLVHFWPTYAQGKAVTDTQSEQRRVMSATLILCGVAVLSCDRPIRTAHPQKCIITTACYNNSHTLLKTKIMFKTCHA